MTAQSFEQEFEQAPTRTIWRIAWPQVLMMVFHFLIGFVDVWVAGRLGKEIQATIGMITQALFFFMVVAIALANGSVAAISQSMGAGKIQRIRRYIGLSLELGFLLSAAIMLIGLLIKDTLLGLLQVPPAIEPVASYILEVFLYILPAYYLFIILNAVFRAQKKVFYPLYAMIIVTSVNTAGDLLFGLGWLGFPNLGYKGLAWSTFFSVLSGMLFNVFLLWRERFLVPRSFPPRRWIRSAFPYLFRVAWPAGLMQVIWHSAYLVLFAITASLPVGSVVALAGMSAGLRVESFLFLPGFAFNFTASILVGHFLGAGQPGEAKRIGYRVMLLGLVAITTLTGLMWLVIEPVTGFIAPDPQVQAETINYLRFNMTGIPFLLIAMILGGAFIGAGATLYQMLIFGVASWGIRIPLSYVLGHLVVQGATGVWAAMLISMIIQAMLALYIFHFWNWQRFAMRARRPECPPESQVHALPRKGT